MAPKASQSASLGSTQEKKMKDAITKLVNDIAKEKKKGAVIKAASTVKPLNEALRNCRKQEINLSISSIEKLAAVLEDDDGDVCSTLDAFLFSVIAQAVLQAEYCLEGERLLYQLAFSLSRDANEANNEAALAGVATRKATIGKECLFPLVEFFLVRENNSDFRRWAGVLCIQLFRGCDDNVQKLELGGENMRRSIGEFISEETNEIVRFICGELVKTLTDQGAEPQTLWPLGTKADIYEPFPLSSQGPNGWTSNFENYVDYLYSKREDMPNGSGQLLPVSSLGFEPRHAFGTPHQNIVASLDSDKLVLLAPALAITSDQILDIPTVLIEQVIITTQKISQSLLARVVFKITRFKDAECHLDGNVIDVEAVSSSVTLKSIKILKSALQDYCPNTVIHEFDESDKPTSSDDQQEASQQSTGISENMMQTQNSPVPISTEPAVNTGKKANSHFQHSQAISRHEIDDADDVDGQVDHDTAAEESTQTHLQIQSRRVINRVKPKAKTPILPGDRRNNAKITPSQENTASQTEVIAKSMTQPSRTQVQVRNNSSHQGSTQPQGKLKMKSNMAPAGEVTSQLKSALKSLRTVAQQNSTQKEKNSADRYPTTAGRFVSSSLKTKSQSVTSDSDSITSPEPFDASTPKLMPPPPKPNSKSAQAVPLKPEASSQSQEKKKKFNRYGVKPSAAQESKADAGMFNAPEDEDDDESELDMKSGNKKGTKKKPASRATTTKAKIKTATSKPKPGRKSAPAVLQKAKAPTRQSQRAAATKANESIRDIIDDDDKIEEIEEVPEANSKPETVQKPKAKAEPTQRSQIDSEESIHPEPKLSSKPLTKEAATSKSVSPKDRKSQSTVKQLDPGGQEFHQPSDQESDTNLHLHLPEADNSMEVDEDLYNATPRKSQSQVQRNSTALAKAHSTTIVASAPSKRVPRNSDIDMASKLENIFEDLDDTEVSKAPDKTKASTTLKLPTKKSSSTSGKGSAQVNKETSDLGKEPNSEMKVMEQVTVASVEKQDKKTLKSPFVGILEFSSPNAPAHMSPVAYAEDNDINLEEARELEDKKDNLIEQLSPDPMVVSIDDSDNATAEPAPKSDDGIQIVSNKDEERKAKSLKASKNVEHGSNKRKTDGNEAGPVKRRKPEEIELARVEDCAQNTTKQHPSRKARQPKQSSPSPLRRSPRLEKVTKAAESLQDAVVGNQLVDEKAHRKPPIISFGVQGPRNQGRTIEKKVVAKEGSVTTKHHPQPEVVSTDSGHKRKRSHADDGENASPLSKRRESSPLQDAENEIAEDDAAPLMDSTPAPNLGIEIKMDRPKLASRLSSQASRVDDNGSPIAPASVQVDHIGKLKQRLVQEDNTEEIEKDIGKGDVISQTRSRRLSEVFGPRIALSARLKAQPSSPEEVTTRYVAHEKTDQGQYTGVASREVIPQEKVLPNPFAEHTRRSSSFTDRLLASAVKKGKKPDDEVSKDRFRIRRDGRGQEVYDLPKLPRETSKVHFLQGKEGRQAFFDPEQTLVESKHRHVNHLSDPSEMTNGSSFQSESSDSSREPLNERPTPNTMWNVALRPHYKTLSEAVHRVADEVIIRLSDEEDRMGLMVEQYRDNGSRIVDNLSKKHDSERTHTLQSLDRKKQEMMSVYTEAKGETQKVADDLKGHQVNRFEKGWSKQQAEITKQISEGRKISE